MKITIDKAVLEHVRAWIAERPEDRTESAGKIVAMLTRALAQPAAQPTEPAGEPVAWDVYVAEHQCGYLIDSLDDPQYLDDATNHGAVAMPLYTRPAVPLPIDYFALQRFAQEHGLDYNALCAVAREDYKIGGAE
jgi:hypothetical protein